MYFLLLLLAAVECFRFPQSITSPRDVTISINHNNKLFNRLTGTFVQIGSDPINSDTDRHIFDGNGMVNAVFFKCNDIIFSNHVVKTKRYMTEKRMNKKIYLNIGDMRGFTGLFKILRHIFYESCGLIPSAKGTANTALLDWNNRIFALHECDMPYELNINFDNGNIETMEQLTLPNVKSVTAHPKMDKENLYLYTYNNYDFSKGEFFYNVLDSDMKIKEQLIFPLINNGIIHDVGNTDKHFIIPDLPLKYDIGTMLKGNMPLQFDKNGVTRFGIIDKKDPNVIDWYDSPENIFLFHFSKCYETKKNFVVYSCNAMEMDMMNLLCNNGDNKGNIRLQKMIFDKDSKSVSIIKNKYLENLDLGFEYNLDFPFNKPNSRHIYCCIFNTQKSRINGLIKIDTKNFKNSKPKVFLFKDKYLCAEPQLVKIGLRDYIVAFSKSVEYSYVSLINIDNGKSNEIELPHNISVPSGFHSIFINKN